MFFYDSEVFCSEELVSTSDALDTSSGAQHEPTVENTVKEAVDCVTIDDKSQWRDDMALQVLTNQLMDVVKSSPDGLVDTEQMFEKLNVSKKRLRKITKILNELSLLKRRRANVYQWMGFSSTPLLGLTLKHLEEEEKMLDYSIKAVKQNINSLHQNALQYKFAYVTYEDLQRIPIFKDDAVFVIKARSEIKLEVTHPKEAFQLHIVGKNGPVDVLGFSESVDVPRSKKHRSKFDIGDYSNVPFRDKVNEDNAAEPTPAPLNPPLIIQNVCTAEPTQSFNIQTSIKPAPVIPQLIIQNSSPLIPPLPVSIKQEMSSWVITPDEPRVEGLAPAVPDPDHLSSDVHMADVS